MDAVTELSYALDTFYFLICGALVMWMAAGFSMLEAGLVRAKSTTEILTKNVALYSVACVMYLLCGYQIMYGGSDSGILPGLGFLIGAENTGEAVLGGGDDAHGAARRAGLGLGRGAAGFALLADRRRSVGRGHGKGRRRRRLGARLGALEFLGLAFQLGDLAALGPGTPALLAGRQPHDQRAEQEADHQAAEDQHEDRDRNRVEGPEVDLDEGPVRQGEHDDHDGQGQGQEPGKVSHGQGQGCVRKRTSCFGTAVPGVSPAC